MLKKIINILKKRKKTIPEQSLAYTKEKLQQLIYNDGKILDVELNKRLIILVKKIEGLIEKNYHLEILDELNGVLLALIESSINKNGELIGSADKIKETLKQYEKFIDEMIKKYEEEQNKQFKTEQKFLNDEFNKFSDVVESMSDDIKKGKGSI
ncbi:hypothetical protein OW763_11205 [Clostridium aestuarii]|uniref:Flagellar protein FliS n=1 Tax=Clostridium aestuarii TaxID=338193 RepID=A0ABT4D0Z2_9CLOT|nr:hypothetical protein [Clostridium aestuarii]MCY6484909.1 hypothetical protein [Clostridium aestuarii]